MTARRLQPARTAIERVRIRVRFDHSQDALPILGDLVRAKRGSFRRAVAGQEAGVGGHVILDVENHHSAKQQEIDALLRWVGHTPATCQCPPPIDNRVFKHGRPSKDSEKFILEAILDWTRRGGKLSEFESPEMQVDTKRAQRMVARHLEKNPEFRMAYLQARQVGAFFMADEIIDIADDPTIPPGQARNMMAARMWAAARANPDLFGSHSKTDLNVNVGFAESLRELESRRQDRSLPAPDLRVIDVEPIPLQVSARNEVRSGQLADD